MHITTKFKSSDHPMAASLRGVIVSLTAMIIWLSGGADAAAQLSNQPLFRDCAPLFNAIIVPNRDEPGRPRVECETQDLVDQLLDLHSAAEAGGGIDNDLLDELLTVARQFQFPWRARVLFDDFADNDFTGNPAWTDPTGRAFVAARTLILDAAGTQLQIPDEFTRSSLSRWQGSSTRRFTYDGSGIIFPEDFSAIATVDSFTGDFIFRFQITELDRTATVGIFPVDLFNRFSETSGTGNIDRMDASWWLRTDGIVGSGNALIDLDFELVAGDVVEFRRIGPNISVFVNGIEFHAYELASFAPVQAMIAAQRLRNDDLPNRFDGVAWFAPLYVRGQQREWDGAIDDFDFSGNSLEVRERSRVIRTEDVFNGDFEIRFRLGPRWPFNGDRFGLYDAAEDRIFDQEENIGRLDRMNESWFVAGNSFKFGRERGDEGSHPVSMEDGNLVVFRRDDGIITVWIANELVHTYEVASTAPLRFVLGSGAGRSLGRSTEVDIDDILWTEPRPEITSDDLTRKHEQDLATGVALDSLRTTIEFTGADLSGIDDGTGDTANGEPLDDEPAESPLPENMVAIAAPADLKPVFAAIATILTSDLATGRFEFGVLDDTATVGFRVAVDTNDNFVSLIETRAGNDILHELQLLDAQITDGADHTVELTRSTEASVEVRINGATVIRIADFDRNDNFDHLVMLVSDGTFAVRSVSLLEIPTP